MLIVGVVLFVIGGSVIYPAGVQQEQDAINAIAGKLNPFKLDFSKPFEVNLSSNLFECSVQDLANGYDPTSVVYLGSSWPFNITFNENAISVSIILTDSNNQTIGWVVNNQWKSDPNSVLIRDRNYNSYAFEIIDRASVPLVQIRLVSSNQIVIGGLFTLKSGRQVAIATNGLGIVTNPTSQNISEMLSPIFKYPSKDHVGELIDPTYSNSMSNNVLDQSKWTKIMGVSLAVIGSIIVGIVGIESFFVTKQARALDTPNQKEQRKSARNVDSEDRV